MIESPDVVVIGAGPAGLATSCELTRHRVDHVVLERHRIADSWRRRWDSFCLVTPNWTINLPDGRYDGDDPDGYLPRDEIVAFFERYAANVGAPVREGVEVTALERSTDGGFALRTSDGDLRATGVVVATGAYQRPHRPPGAASLPRGLTTLDIDNYRNPDQIPAGKVLIVGSGQSGCQVAEELHHAGRQVFLSCGRAPWLPRRIGDRDLVWWAIETGFIEQPFTALPDAAERLTANLLSTGDGGGRTLNLRTLRALGVTLLGHFRGADGRRAFFAPDLAETQAWGDERYGRFISLVRDLVAERGLPMPDIADPPPFDARAPEELDLAGFGAVIFAGGFRPDYASWIRVPGAFDADGYPVHAEGASTAAPGLHFVGVHFLRKRKSSILWGVGEDAAIVATAIASATTAPRS